MLEIKGLKIPPFFYPEGVLDARIFGEKWQVIKGLKFKIISR